MTLWGLVAVLGSAALYLYERGRRLEAQQNRLLADLGAVLAQVATAADQTRDVAATAPDANLRAVVRTLDNLVVFIREVQESGRIPRPRPEGPADPPG